MLHSIFAPAPATSDRVPLYSEEPTSAATAVSHDASEVTSPMIHSESKIRYKRARGQLYRATHFALFI